MFSSVPDQINKMSYESKKTNKIRKQVNFGKTMKTGPSNKKLKCFKRIIEVCAKFIDVWTFKTRKVDRCEKNVFWQML